MKIVCRKFHITCTQQNTLFRCTITKPHTASPRRIHRLKDILPQYKIHVICVLLMWHGQRFSLSHMDTFIHSLVHSNTNHWPKKSIRLEPGHGWYGWYKPSGWFGEPTDCYRLQLIHTDYDPLGDVQHLSETEQSSPVFSLHIHHNVELLPNTTQTDFSGSSLHICPHFRNPSDAYIIYFLCK